MSTRQSESVRTGAILFAAGLLSILFGASFYSERFDLAHTFFGANSLFGMPFTGEDALKVLFVQIVGGFGVATGVVLAIVGATIFLRQPEDKGRVSSSSAAPLGR